MAMNYSSLSDYVDNKDLLVLHPSEETMDIADSVKDSFIMNDVLAEETVHFDGVSLTSSISLSRSRSSMSHMTKSNLIMDTLIEEEECDKESKGLKSQSQDLESHSLSHAQRFSFREDPMERIE